jgi:integrase/recombinase XerD
MRNDDIDRFLKSLSLAPKSRYTYVTSLRAFHVFAQKRARPSETMSIETVRAWLKRDAARSPFKNVVGRAGIIVRYLNWKAAATTLHPFAELKQHYGGRLMTIVRALLREDYRDVLERLRPLPEWSSSLGPLMREHVARMQSLGYRYETRARDLRRFDRYLQRNPELNGEPFPVLIEAWQSSGRTPRHRLMVQLCARALSQAMHRRDEKIPIRTIEIALQRRVSSEERKAYIYSEAEIVRLFKAARSFRSRCAPLRGITVHTVLALAYCAGLRIGEIGLDASRRRYRARHHRDPRDQVL